jgi:alpha-beta hydrolase superfamily lysophospholipase
MEQTDGFFHTRDGMRLYRRAWGPSPGKGLLVLVHGFGDHSGRYQHLVAAMTDRGYRLHTYDTRGHGQSGGRRGHVERFDEYLEELEDFLELVRSEEGEEVPLFLLGHSQGGHTVLRYGILNPEARLQGIVASSPFLGVAVKVPAVKTLAGTVMSRLWPTFTQSVPLRESDLSHDLDVIEATRNDPLYSRLATARWYSETVQTMEETLHRAGELRFPLLVQQAGEDRIVKAEASRRFFDAVTFSDRRWIEYPGYFHEIYNETPDRRGPVFADLASWLAEHLHIQRTPSPTSS